MRLTSIISSLIAMIAICFLIYSQRNVNLSREQLLDEQMISKVETANNLATGKLQTCLEDSVSALQGYIEGIKGKDDILTETVYQELEKMTSAYGFEQTFLCDLDGNVYTSSTNSIDVSEADYYKASLLGDTVISYKNLSLEGKNTVIFCVPVIQENETKAVLITSWSEDMLSSLLSTSGFRGKEEVCLINSEAKILFSLSGDYEEGASLLSLWNSKDRSYLNTEQVIKQGRYCSDNIIGKADVDYCFSYKGIRKLSDWGVATVIKTEDIIPMLSASYGSVKDYLYVGIAGVLTLVLLGVLIYQSKRRYNLQRLAYFDQVTKSYNFKGFMKRMYTMFEKDPNAKFALLEVTFEKFDYFQEIFGNDITNQTLRDMADTIEHYLHTDEAYCRYNTLNFIIMIKYQNEEELKDRLVYLKEKIDKLDGKGRLNDKFDYNLEIGVYCLTQKDIGIDTMINRANAALQVSLNNRYAPFEFYKSSMENSKSEDREYEEHMYDALHEKEFLVYLQPKFSLKNGKQVGAEALVRWMHPEKGLLYPGRFITLFEKNGFIAELDMYILREICDFLKVCIRKGIKPKPLSFNVSLNNLYKADFAERVIEIVEKSGVPANLICLELGEDAIAKNIVLIQEILENLKMKGFLISMDDFGDGTTSMNTLYQVPVDELKIDRKFLLKTENSERGRSIINSIIETSRKLDIQVVAEGVENKLQAQMLRELGCDMMQGFVFCEPLPMREYEEYAYGARADENSINI